jgi:2-polyprenyl-3-methyl-5-hydroxy-6-metoxy-1,4-benzoquinol methylase
MFKKPYMTEVEDESSFLRCVHETCWNSVKDESIGLQPDWYICQNGIPPKGKRILCIGCADGKDIAFLAKANKVIGIDIIPEAIEMAKKYGINSQIFDVSQGINFAEKSFDVIICKEVLEHLLDPAFVVKEIHRTLKDDGYAVISVPNHFCIGQRVRILLGKGLIWKSLLHDHTKSCNEWDYMHIRFFTYQGFKKFLKYCGFNILSFQWDIGPFIISRPDLITSRAKHLINQGKFDTKKKILAKLLIPLLKTFDLLLPRRVRSNLVKICPGLLTNHFYVHCRKY